MWFLGRGVVAALNRALELISQLREELAGQAAARAVIAQRLAEVKIDHARELEEYRRRLSVNQANFEWLSVSHNQLAAEVQAFRNARSGVNLTPLTVDFIAPPSPGPAGEPSVRPARVAVDELAGASAIDAGLSFDDMGDREAAIAGVGSRVYDGGDTLLRE